MVTLPADARQRVVIENVTPEIEAGRFPIKRILGDVVQVEADVFADGHDAVACVLLSRKDDATRWDETRMTPLGNDRWHATFKVAQVGGYRYTVLGWVDAFTTWARDIAIKIEATQDIAVDRLIGARLLKEAGEKASDKDRSKLSAWADVIRASGQPEDLLQIVKSEDLMSAMKQYAERRYPTTYDKPLAVIVDRKKARFSSWYEMFPRSQWSEQEQSGGFKACEARLPYLSRLGFDVLYLPPIHPIGRRYRKGPNNSTQAGPGDPGSPWAIGAEEGGHKSIHPELGTLEDFQRLRKQCEAQGIEIALDLAFQCSPEHPYVKANPEFFRWRPDGSVQYAENPPKKYQDIYPFDFETQQRQRLWDELLSIVTFWVGQGVRIFRVDNPHTKPFGFWEWLIASVKQDHPDVLFLSEAFTRPKVMYRLAKLGFTQSYTYFAWRNTKWELTEYFTELTRSPVAEFFRANLWPNTPDILTEYLQTGGRPAFMIRFTLAATLGASYGIYGPAFELGEHRPREAGSEEYLNAEKYEIKHWDIEREDSLQDLIARINRIRRQNPALQSDYSLQFHGVENDHLLCYSKTTEDLGNIILTAINLDPHHTQSGWTNLRLDLLGMAGDQPFEVQDLLTDARYLWRGPRNFLELNPAVMPAHIFRIRRKIEREPEDDRAEDEDLNA
jgi:starch synthase (maltosyl-transferring)